MSEKEKEYIKFKDEADVYFGGLRPEITNFIEELKAEKSELIECLKRCNRDIPRINDILASCGFHPFTLMEKDIKETLQNHEVNK